MAKGFPIETCQPFTGYYRVPFNLIHEKAKLMKRIDVKNLTKAEAFTLEELSLFPVHLFATISMENLAMAPNITIQYFKINDNVFYSYTEFQPNPLCRVILPMFMVEKKIRIARVALDTIEFEIHENGFPPLCRLQTDADNYLVHLD